ncbi:hypothetical protein M0802_013030 [Mischocyttarus mexicanus]|nr:hypothetical protein M0802_013030 [Mischocyttarus mexicanus]
MSSADAIFYSDSASIRRRTNVETALNFDLSLNAERQSPISSSMSLPDAKAYYDPGSIRRRTKVKTSLDFDLSCRPKSVFALA